MSSVPFNPQTPCDQCGRNGAYQFSTSALCLDCYEIQGSCCALEDKDDES